MLTYEELLLKEKKIYLRNWRPNSAALSGFKHVGHLQQMLSLFSFFLCGPSHRQPELSAAQKSLHGRRELLEQVCLSQNRKRQVLSPDDLKHLIVDDKHSLIYCYVPKVG